MVALEYIVNKLASDNSLSEEQKQKAVKVLSEQKLNILLVGSTGAGKSSTINALFDISKAKVGESPYPETTEVVKYDLDNLVLWDSPGLGDGDLQDKAHTDKIINILRKNNGSHALIDIVLVILDGSTRDMSVAYKLINDVVIPNVNDSSRVIIAINQADLAYKGNNSWNYSENKPTPEAYDFLEKKAESVSNRVKDSTGIIVYPIYYCAGFKGSPPYNLSKLLWLIVSNTPVTKRLAFKDSKISQNKNSWEHSDNKVNYKKEIKESLGLGTLVKGAASLIFGFFGFF